MCVTVLLLRDDLIQVHEHIMNAVEEVYNIVSEQEVIEEE